MRVIFGISEISFIMVTYKKIVFFITIFFIFSSIEYKLLIVDLLDLPGTQYIGSFTTAVKSKAFPTISDTDLHELLNPTTSKPMKKFKIF